MIEESRAMADYNKAPPCPDCGGEMFNVITGGQGFTRVMGAADNPGYKCVVTGEYVTSKRRRREIMAEHSLVEAPSADTKGAHNPTFT